MVISSSYIGQQIASQQSWASGQQAYAQQLSHPWMPAGSPPPPPMQAPPPMTAFGAANYAAGGMYGEQMASRIAGAGQMMGGLASGVAGIGMSMAGVDPIGIGMRAGMAGGLGAGVMAAGAAALPMYAASKAVEVYGGAFMGGMRDQAGLNSTLRNNFQHFGGQGPVGRGFNQDQMGQIGGVISRELRTNVFSSAGELNQLIAGGAEAGMMTGVRDVQQFSQSFRKMIDTLKSVQRELGGNLTEALRFVSQSRQAGIYQQVDRVNFAGEIRGAEAASGMSRDQLMGMAVQGAAMSRGVGGVGRQGAVGALRMASQLGGAVQSGAVNEELLSEATGGLTGSDAIHSFTMNMLQRSAQFSRRGMGRFSAFAMSNAEGTGLDESMMQRFEAGDLTTSQVSRAAHGRVRGMGRARAMNQEGHLRGAMMEQGGLAGMIGMTRLQLGDRVLDQGDDFASMVMQRRMHMSRPEAEMMTSLMRNQGSIATQESFDRGGASRQQAMQTDLRDNRSLDAFFRRLEHGVQEESGVTATRELGRRFTTRVSSIAERAMNDVLGIVENQMSQQDTGALNRLSVGRASASDLERLRIPAGMAGSGANLSDRLFQRGLLGGQSPGEVLRARGVGMRDIKDDPRGEVNAAQAARSGELLMDRDRRVLDRLNANTDQTRRDIGMAQLIASGSGGDPNDFYRYMGGGVRNANAIDAFRSRDGQPVDGINVGAGALMNRGGNGAAGVLARNALRLGASAIPGIGGFLATGMGALGIGGMGMESMSAPGEDNAAYIASGGDLARSMERGGARERSTLERHRGALSMLNPVTAAMGLPGFARAMSGGSGGMDSWLHGQAHGRSGQILEGLRSVSVESVNALRGSDEFRSQMGRVTGAHGRDSQETELVAFERYGARLGDRGQRDAATSIAAQMRARVNAGQNLDQYRSLTFSQERYDQMRDERNRMGDDFAGFSRGLGDHQGSLGRRSSRIAGMLRGNASPEAINRETMGMSVALAHMDPASERYHQAMQAFNVTDETGTHMSDFGRSQVAASAQYRQFERAVVGPGGGRRGAPQRAETSLGALTGGSLSEMEGLTVNGRELGRRNRAQQIERVLQHGGANATSLIQQMSGRLEGMGMTGGGAMLGQYQQMLQSGGGIDAGESARLFQMTGSNEGLQRIQREAVARHQAQQNPMNPDHRHLLERIATATETAIHAGGDSEPGAAGGVPRGEPGH